MSALTDQVIWVTGASRGLGRAVVVELVGRGATVVATSRTGDDLEVLQSEVRGPGRIDPRPGSVDVPDDVDGIVESAIAEHGRIDALVNCAGISPSFAQAVKVDDETFERVLAVNVHGSFRCIRAVAPHMLERGSGAIVNVSSVHARAGFERIVAYSASKGAIDAMTRSLAVEWAARGVRVNGLAPGYFRTDLSSGLLESAWGEEIVRRVPMGRVGAPAELAPAAAFLVSPESSYMTGSIMTVDGGWTAW